MSRSGLIDEGDMDDQLAYGRWRAMVRSASKGRRGQALFRDLAAALDAMPEKRLITDDLETAVVGMPFRLEGGDVCALGAVGRFRGIDLDPIDPHDPSQVSAAFDIAECLAQEIVYFNDEVGLSSETPEQRWVRMRKWVDSKIAKPAP